MRQHYYRSCKVLNNFGSRRFVARYGSSWYQSKSEYCEDHSISNYLQPHYECVGDKRKCLPYAEKRRQIRKMDDGFKLNEVRLLTVTSNAKLCHYLHLDLGILWLYLNKDEGDWLSRITERRWWSLKDNFYFNFDIPQLCAKFIFFSNKQNLLLSRGLSVIRCLSFLWNFSSWTILLQ